MSMHYEKSAENECDGQTDGVQTYSPSKFHRWGTNKR